MLPLSPSAFGEQMRFFRPKRPWIICNSVGCFACDALRVVNTVSSCARATILPGTFPRHPIPASRIIDTSGAGDVFHGAYIYAYLKSPKRRWSDHFEYRLCGIRLSRIPASLVTKRDSADAFLIIEELQKRLVRGFPWISPLGTFAALQRRFCCMTYFLRGSQLPHDFRCLLCDGRSSFLPAERIDARSGCILPGWNSGGVAGHVERPPTNG